MAVALKQGCVLDGEAPYVSLQGSEDSASWSLERPFRSHGRWGILSVQGAV